ncbi:transcriptional regulator, partial [Pseudomonas aeruginosa]|nr:transcriptional regulator [Pseudomonas aeruginosa]
MLLPLDPGKRLTWLNTGPSGGGAGRRSGYTARVGPRGAVAEPRSRCMSLRPTLALLALVSLPLMAAQNDPQPSSKELMKEHQAQIQNDLADVDYKRKRIVEAN